MMSYIRNLTLGLRGLFRKSEVNREMEEELRHYVDSATEENHKKGLSAEQALRAARVAVGSFDAVKERTLGVGWENFVDSLWQDLGYAARMLRKSPGFTVIAVLSLALGIGANTIIFSLAKEVLLETLAVPHPEQLRLFSIEIGENSPVSSEWGDYGRNASRNESGHIVTSSFPYPAYQQLRRQNHSLEDLFAFKDFGRINATIDGQAEVVLGELVSGNYYQQMGVVPSLGRPITPADDAVPGAGAVAVISDGFWARRFGRSRDLLGKTIQLNLTPITIIGVNPPHFTGAANPQMSPDIFLPISMQPILLPRKTSLLTDGEMWWVQIMGRVKPEVSQKAAQAALDLAFIQAVRATMPVKEDEQIPRLNLLSGGRGQNHAARDFAKAIYMLMSLAGLVLLLACANLANLMLARAAARQREMGVRVALGASRGRILRQVLTESLLLSLLGGVAGLMLAYLGRNIIPHLLAASWEPAPFSSVFDGRIFAFTAALSAFTGMLFGIGPMWQATRTSASKELKDSAATSTARRKSFAGKAIVAFQIALSLLLIVSAGLFVRTLANLNTTAIGFQPKRLLLFDLNLPKSRYPAVKSIALMRQLGERFATVPGVDLVTLSEAPLLANRRWLGSFHPDSSTSQPGQQSPFENRVGEYFFSTMGIPLISGRSFDAGDTETSPKVAVVNQALAKKYFGNTNPIGRTFNQGIEIVGICADAKFTDLRDDPPPTFYLLYRQQEDASDMTFEIRTKGDPMSVIGTIREAVRSIDKDLPLIDVRTQTEQIEQTMAQERIFAALTSAFGVLALLLASIGIYGIMAYTVSRRTHEIGVRMALGAQRRKMLLMVLRETSWLAWTGTAVGLIAALGLTPLISSMLYGLKPTDPLTLLWASCLLFVIAILAGWIPARRAASVQPVTALRHE